MFGIQCQGYSEQMLSSLIVVVYTQMLRFLETSFFSEVCVNYLIVCCAEKGAV